MKDVFSFCISWNDFSDVFILWFFFVFFQKGWKDCPHIRFERRPQRGG